MIFLIRRLLKRLVCLALLSSLCDVAIACQFHGDIQPMDLEFSRDILDNLSARSLSHNRTTGTKLAITNVRVFDGSCLLPASTVIIDGDSIGHLDAPYEDCAAMETYDAKGKTLLPGLIDSHAHPVNATHTGELTKYGVTTTVVAFCANPALCNSLSNHTGYTSIVKGSFIATSPNSSHAKLVGTQGAPYLIQNASQASSFVNQQVAQGVDFIKMIGSAPLPGLSQEEQNAVVAASHKVGKQVILHTSSYAAYYQGLVAGADQIHHSTLDTPIDDRLLELFKAKKKKKPVVCPTLTMMRAIVDQLHPANESYEAASETVTRLHKIGITILAGTDANLQPNTPAKVEYGISLHDELQNLVDAGLSPLEALNAATSIPAKHFGLSDRGSIREGMRADLLLVDGDPTEDIAVTRRIEQVWVGGVAYEG